MWGESNGTSHLSQFKAYGLKIHTNSIIQHFRSQFPGKTRVLIPESEHSCVWDESHDSSEERS